MKCPRCGYPSNDSFFGAVCGVCGSGIGKASSITAGGIAGEWSPPASSLLKSMFSALCLSLVKPEKFFSTVNVSSSIRGPLVYGLAIGGIATILAIGAEVVFPPSFFPLLNSFGIFGRSSNDTALILLFTPLLLIMQFFLVAAYAHIILKISGSRPKPFSTTLKIMCYCEGAAMLQWIPLLGQVLSLIAWLRLAIAGLHVFQEISKFRASMVIILPLLILFVLLAMMVIFVFIGVLLLGGSPGNLLDFLNR